MKLDKNIYKSTLDFFKRRFIELFGLLLISLFFIFFYSLFNYSPENSTLIYKTNELDVESIFKEYSNIIADFFLQSFGLISFLIGLSILSWGIILVVNKKINNLLGKVFYTVIYINLGCLFIYLTNNNSFWLIDNGNSGFMGEQSFNIINKFAPLIDKDFVKVFILLFTLLFFVLGSGINLRKIFEKFFLKKNRNEFSDITSDTESVDVINEPEENKQQSFSFV